MTTSTSSSVRSDTSMNELSEEPEHPFVDPHEEREARRVRIAAGAFGAVLFVTMVLSIHLSTLDLSFGTLLYGSSRVWRGHDAHFRVVAADPRGNMRRIPITGGELVLRDARGERARVPLGGPIGELSFRVPPDLADGATAELRVTTELGEDRFTQTLRAVDAPEGARARILSHRELLSKRARPKEGSPYELRLYPRSGVLVDGLENAVVGWVSAGDGATAVHSDNPSFRADTDEDGLFDLRWLPRPSPIGYAFTIGEAPGLSRTVSISNEQRQLVAETDPSAFARPGDEVQLVVRTLPVREPLYIDLWVGSTLVYAVMLPASSGRLETSVPIPPDYEGLARIDVYRSIFAPEHSSSSIHLWVSEDPPEDAVTDAVRALSGFPGSDPSLDAALAAEGAARKRFGEMALSRVVPNTVGNLLVRTTVEERAAAVDERRARVRGAVNTLFVITFGLGVALAVGWAIRNHLRVRRNVRAVMEDGIAHGEEIDSDAIEELTRVRDLYDFALVLAALFLAAYSLLTLMQTIRWE